MAVQLIVVPTHCGDAQSDDKVTVLTADAGAEVTGSAGDERLKGAELGISSIAKADSVHASKSSTALPALRTHTDIRYRGLANAGVHRSVFECDQFFTTSHADPLWSSHLYWYGPRPPRGVAVQVMVVPAGCGTERSAVRFTATMDVDGIGVARIDALLMSIRAALSKAQAKIEIPRQICQRLKVSEGKTGIDAGRARSGLGKC